MIQLSDLIKVDYFQLKEQPRTGKQKAHQWLQAVEPTIEIRSVFSFTRLPDQIMSLEETGNGTIDAKPPHLSCAAICTIVVDTQDFMIYTKDLTFCTER